MMYQAYEAHANLLALLRPLALGTGAALRLPGLGLGHYAAIRKLAGMLETFAKLSLTHVRLPFGIATVTVGNDCVAVSEEPIYSTAFATLLHFKKDSNVAQPRVLVVAPMSGHFATLLRATVNTILVDHDVYITDWYNARDIRLSEGQFDFSSFVDHIIKFLQILGEGAHVVAVCQPCVPVLAAAALMAEDQDPAEPRSMTLMGGPIDTRINPTAVNELAVKIPISWFEENLITEVPFGYKRVG